MNSDHRGISPVIGVTLLVAVVVTLAAVSGAMLFALSEDPEPAPDVALTMENGDGPATHVIRHKGGDELDGGHVELQGTTDSDTLSGAELSAGDTEKVHATDETVEVVWKGEDGTSYVLRTFEVDSDQTVPSPDEGCSWVESETNDGTDSVTVDGITVDCDVTTDENVKIQNGGVVIGESVSDAKLVEVADSTVYGDTAAQTSVDADSASFYGSVEGGDVVDLQDSSVTGSVTSTNANVKLGNGTVDGSVDAESKVEVQAGSSVDGDVTSNDLVKVIGDSSVDGSVDAASDVDVKNGGHVSGAVATDAGIEVDDGTVGGPIDAVGVVDVIAGSSVGGDIVTDDSVGVSDSQVSGSVTSRNKYVDIENTSVEGSIDAPRTIEITAGSSAEGDITSDEQVKILDSEVSGSVVSTDSVKLDDATVEGDVYVDSADFDCTDSTINGQDCGDYSPKDPDDY